MAHLGAVGAMGARTYSIPGKTISGTVRDAAGLVAVRSVYMVADASGAAAPIPFEKYCQSAPDGTYAFSVGDGLPRTLIFSGEPGRNALVLRGVVPV